MVTEMASEQQELVILQNLETLQNEIQQDSICCDQVCSSIKLDAKLLNILHLNIRSIHKNFNEFLVFLEAYNIDFSDILVLGESFECHDNDYYIEGYTMFANGARYNRNDGVVIFIKSDLIFDVRHTSLEKSKVTMTNITLSKNNKLFNIICLYRPPETNKFQFLEDLERYLMEFKLPDQVDIFVGDANINILDKNENSVNSYLSLLSHFGFVSYINAPTRITSGTSTCLDHIFIRDRLNIRDLKYSSYVLQSDLTDHCPIMLNIYMTDSISTNKPKTTMRTTTKINEQTFTNNIKLENWEKVLQKNSVKEATDEFYKIMADIFEKSSHTRTYVVKENNRIKRKPWITNGIITSIKNRDKMKQKLLRNFNDNYYKAYKDYRNTIKTIIEKRKHEYYHYEIVSAGKNIKKVYNLIAEATNNKVSSKNAIMPIINNNGASTYDKKKVANICNDYFIDVGIDMYRKIPKPITECNLKSNSLSSLYLKPVDSNEIINHINNLKNGAAPGMDNIGVKLIKNNHIYLTTPLVHIINLILSKGEVPEQFKISLVTPIFKSGDKSNISNYRPISVINNFSKIFEKCLKDRLLNFFQVHKIISKNQYGFVHGSGTSDALYELTKQITEKLENNEKCVTVFLDLAKAFDTVPHDRLLDVLSRNGVRGTALCVFESYLKDRQQYLKIEDALSDPLRVKMGVPQGTVLGPILFITYINSLTDLQLDNGSIISYADDTAAIFSAETWHGVRHKAAIGLTKIKSWLDNFKLTLNIQKTKYIAFSLTEANRPHFESIHIDNLSDSITETSYIKYLGVIVDKHLKWDQHSTYLTKNLRKLIYKFYILRDILNKELLISVYKALVESIIRYGVIVWGGLYNSALRQLNVVQNYILKVIFKKNKRFSTGQLYTGEILNIRSLYILEVCAFTYKNKDLKEYIDHNYDTRGKVNKHIIVPTCHTNLNLRSIRYLAPKIYNLIPMGMKNVKNVKMFRKVCRLYIVSRLELFLVLF